MSVFFQLSNLKLQHQVETNTDLLIIENCFTTGLAEH